MGIAVACNVRIYEADGLTILVGLQMRKIGIDYGEARIGLAVCDPMGIIASPLETFVRKYEADDAKRLKEIFKRHEADTLVFGLPLNMDGSESDMSERVRGFAELFSGEGYKIEFLDERMSSMQSINMLSPANLSPNKRRQVVDKVAAQIILQNYLDKK